MKLILILICTFSISAFSQKLENLKAVSAGDRIIITYDLNAEVPSDKYDVQIYSSYNNFSSPLKYLIGDVGNSLTSGIGKRIEWEAKKELGNFKGDLSFEIRAEIKAIFAFKNSVMNTKRGKPLTVAWRGGLKNEEVRVVLLKEGVEQSSLATVNNTGNYQWTVPSKQKTGGGYQVQLVNGKETITSGHFSINHKIPMILKILPVAIIGAVVALTSGSKDSGTETSNLATPPDLGLN